jgi:hypothetical protein
MTINMNVTTRQTRLMKEVGSEETGTAAQSSVRTRRRFSHGAVVLKFSLLSHVVKKRDRSVVGWVR